MIYFKEFPTVEIPPLALELGFIDSSWHNDAGPRMIHQSQAEIDDANSPIPILTFMCGGEDQAAELGSPDAAYLVYWAVYGCEHDQSRASHSGPDLINAMMFLAMQRDLLLWENQK